MTADTNLIYGFAVWVIPILMAITLHEAGHAWAANCLGDSTAKQLGRVSLNPLPHIDLIGTILLPLVLFLTTPIIFGWAKPVPVDTRYFKKPKQSMAWVALAGPGANFLMAVFWAVVVKVSYTQEMSALQQGFTYMGLAGIFINLLLAFFNLVPCPPLDGGRIMTSVLPPKLANSLSRVEPYGMFIVIGLFLFAGLDKLLFKMLITTESWILGSMQIDNSAALLLDFFKRFL